MTGSWKAEYYQNSIVISVKNMMNVTIKMWLIGAKSRVFLNQGAIFQKFFRIAIKLV